MSRVRAGGLNEAVAAVLKGELATAGITQEQLAEQIGVHKTTVQRLLATPPKRQMDVQVLYNICLVIDETPSTIVTRAQERMAKQERDREAARILRSNGKDS